MTIDCAESKRLLLAWVTVVACFKVGRDVGRTWTVLPQPGVKYSESTSVRARARGLHEVHVVHNTPEVPVVSADTTAALHASVAG